MLDSFPLERHPSGDPLTRSGPTVESIYGADLSDPEFAIEVSEGSYELDEDRLADGSSLDDDFGALGGWIAATPGAWAMSPSPKPAPAAPG